MTGKRSLILAGAPALAAPLAAVEAMAPILELLEGK